MQMFTERLLYLPVTGKPLRLDLELYSSKVVSQKYFPWFCGVSALPLLISIMTIQPDCFVPRTFTKSVKPTEKHPLMTAEHEGRVIFIALPKISNNYPYLINVLGLYD